MPYTPFLGREDALATVAELLGREDVRLVTLTGPGGIGKTRLALQAAADAADGFADGVWWIPLAPLEDPALVLSTIAQTLQIGGTGGDGVGAALAERLSGRRVLILIDNAEHLLPAVADAIAQLAAIDGPQLCVTSRARLALPGEHIFPVPSLSDADAVGLFMARARQLDPAYTETLGLPALCRQLDNLPLAIELAAARSSLFSVQELAERLGRDLALLKGGSATEDRHRTLQAAIDWSYRLLTEEEQRIYRALSLFRGGCTVNAIEQIASANVDTVGSLLDKSLIRRRDGDGGPRVFMLEMVRRHAAALLADDAHREALVVASARYFTDLMEQAFARVTTFGGDDARWWGVICDERDNVRASLELHHAQGDAESLARLCAAEWLLWYFVGDPSEGATWLTRALALGPPRRLRSQVENARAALLLVSGQAAASTELAATAVEHAREIADGIAEAAALITLGNGLTGTAEQGGAAKAAWTEAAAVARATGADWWVACAITNLAVVALNYGDHEEAARQCAELERLGATSNAILDLPILSAEVSLLEGDLERARAHLLRAMERRPSAMVMAAYGEVTLAARIVAGDGRLEDAAVLLAATAARHAELGFQFPADWLRADKDLGTQLAETLAPERLAAASARGRLLSHDETIALAIALMRGA